MRKWLAHSMLSTARYLISTARRIYPPTVTWVDGTGKRWTSPGPQRGVIAFRTDSAVYRSGAPGPAMQRYLDDLESRGWN